MANDDTVAIIRDLQDQIDQLKQEVTRLRRTSHGSTDQPEVLTGEPTSNRRNLLKLAGAAAVGTVASVAVAGRAAAEIGYNTTGGSLTVGDAVQQLQTSSLPGKTAFVFQTVGGGGNNNSSGFPGALGGWSYDIDAPNGVYGYSAVSNGRGVIGYTVGAETTGVYGESQGTNGIGVLGTSQTGVSGMGYTYGVIGSASEPSSSGVRGLSVASGGRGVYGSAIGNDAAGVLAIGEGTGAVGVNASGAGTGVKAVATDASGVGVDAQAQRYGVYGRASQADGSGVIGTAFGVSARGVYGAGGASGVQGYSESDGGVGGTFGGNAGSLKLNGWRGTPSARTHAHARYVIDNDNDGNIWYCYEAGTPGKWVKLAGPGTAGTFHPLSPGRVYDSREPQPSPGALAGGGNRTISVADRRAVAGGAVAQANFVPAGATAVAANITIVTQSGAGFLAANPGGVTEISASTINWSASGQILANGVILTLNANREITIVAGGGSTHFLIDLTGYWL